MLLLSTARIQSTVLQTMLGYQVEALSFMQNRSQQHLQLWRDLLASDYARDSFDLYCSFWRNALQDYSDETKRLARMGAHLATEAAKCTRDEQEELTERVATKLAM